VENETVLNPKEIRNGDVIAHSPTRVAHEEEYAISWRTGERGGSSYGGIAVYRVRIKIAEIQEKVL
jgi:hypothetical protein